MSVETESENLTGVRIVSNKDELNSFLNFVYDHYEQDDCFVPPLFIEQKKLVDRVNNPFYQEAEADFFLAEKNGEIAGRVAAVLDHRYNKEHGTNIGFFAFYESIDNISVAKLLLRVVNDWMRKRGVDSILGPTNPGLMDVIGFLTEGFDVPPSIMMPYTKAFYPALFEKMGFEKAQDLLAFRIKESDLDFERLNRIEDIVLKRLPGLKLRKINIKKINDEILIVQDLFNRAWAKNWGFTPLTLAEVKALAADFKMILDPEIALIAEMEGQPIGFSVSLPDLNVALKHVHRGRLFPFGLFKLLYHKRKITSVRTALMGVIPEFQGKGIEALLNKHTIVNGMAKGYTSSELSWVLESNTAMIRVAERLGSSVEKRYRLFTKKVN